MDWKLSGKDEPHTEQDSEVYLAFNLELISTKACSGLAPIEEPLDKKREMLVQGDQEAWLCADSILRLVDQFKLLKPPIIKSMSDIQKISVIRANLPLRLFLRIAKLYEDPTKQSSPDLSIHKMLRIAQSYDAIVAKERILMSRPIHEGTSTVSSCASLSAQSVLGKLEYWKACRHA